MDILNVILLSLFSLIALFILTKLMGYRQMSEMSMFDYINGITIGSIAAEMATSLEKDWWLFPGWRELVRQINWDFIISQKMILRVWLPAKQTMCLFIFRRKG